MASLVQELEHDAYDSAASLSNMLRKAKAVAVKLQLRQPIEWVEAELNGYTTDIVPPYRMLRGRLKAHNPYNGLIPIHFADTELESIVSQYHSRDPIENVERFAERSSNPMLPIVGKPAEILSQMMDGPNFPMYLLLTTTSFQGILNAVRNKVLDWSLQLQADGIMGEGMSFLAEEKAKVNEKGHTYNIGSIGSFTGNLGGQVGGNVTATSTQNMAQELEKVTALVAQLRTYQEHMGLGEQQQAEISRNVDALDEELRGEKPKPGIIMGLLRSIKATAEGAAGNLVVSGVISAISNINL